MKMPRSECEAQNVQFVQELAEVDGPFEAPINVNFRDLTKLELPALVWNRSDSCPRKMKLTNTGHTVIVSAKWNSERPYLTGGPLLGKYVFSQIHFHWGQSDCRGSEHQICGEQFPLEMHVAHFKTEYATQESALREKDGMVVVVYLFKLQEEPNHSLKKIINSLPRVKQPSTSFAIDPRPIVSLCHPFTEDYFMYWGSVVTSTCAHILLWIICREPFGISREQVSEFRKIMDSSQHPICKNNREVQPLHKRNVFHVNASKHLDNPLLPIKKRLGCYCKESKNDFNNSNSCHCHGAFQTQEDVEGNFPERADFEGAQTEHSCFANQNFVVQTATMRSLSSALKRTGSDPIKNQRPLNKLKKVKSEVCNKQVKLVSKGFNFFPTLDTRKINNMKEKRKVREKNKLFTSVKAFSQIMHSLEALKNQTFKKLKKIEAINQEIKEMKPFCQDTEDKRWIRRIEKMVLQQKRFTIKSSQGCLCELKKLAKDCNFDRYFDSKPLPTDANSQKMVWFTKNMIATAELPCYDNPIESEGIPEFENKPSEHSVVGKTVRFSSKAQELIASFFEDIKDCEDLQETVTKDPNFKKIKSLCGLARDSKTITAKNMGYITQKMFNLGNLGDRFFTEITTEDMNLDENSKFEEQYEELTTVQDVNETKNVLDCHESENLTKTNIESKSKICSPQRVLTPISSPKTKEEENGTAETLADQDAFFKDEAIETFLLKKTSKKIHLMKSVNDTQLNLYEVTDEKSTRTHETKVIPSKSQSSSLNLSTDSTDIKTTKKVQKLKKGFLEQNKRKSSVVFKISSRKLHSKTSFKKFEGVNTQNKNQRNKEKKNQKVENAKNKNLSSTSKEEDKEEENAVLIKLVQEKIETKSKKEVEKETTSSDDFVTETALISPQTRSLRENTFINLKKNVCLTTTETRTIITNPSPKHRKIREKLNFVKAEQENLKKKESAQKLLKESFSEEQQSVKFESTDDVSRTISKTFTNKTYRASSVDSKTSYSKTGALKESGNNQFDLRIQNEILKKEEKPLVKTSCRSLTNLLTRPKPDFAQRLQLESIDSRKKTNQDVCIRKLKGNQKVLKDSPQETTNEMHKNLNEDQEPKEANQELENQEKLSKSQNTLIQYEVEIPKKNPSQMNNESLPKVQIQNEQENNISVKQGSARKNQFEEEGDEESLEILRPTDSDRSFARNASKGNADFLDSDNKNCHTSVSCWTLKRNSKSRLHSAETLHPLKTTQKRKSKKRPYCSKRNSRQYIRKNYSVLKKPSKPFNFLSLTDEEQLKIISANVAKYIKQKLIDEKTQLETEKNSFINAKKESTILSTPEEKIEEKPKQQSPAVNPQKTKRLRIPVLKSIERPKDKEKDEKNIKKPNIVESPIETVKQKPELYSSTRPVSNFIKLNKQMAGTYKRLPPTALKVNELKGKENSNLGIKTTNKTSKPNAKIQKKINEKVSAEKLKKEDNQKPQTPSSPTTRTPSQKGDTRKEKQIKAPTAYKKPDSNSKTIKKAQASSPKANKPNESVGVKRKRDSEKALTPSANSKETISAKKSVISICTTINCNSATPETVENLGEQNSQNEVIKCDTEEDIKNEALLKRELEYFITMQMYLNNEISKGIENPLHYFGPKLLLSDNTVSENVLGNDTLQNFCNKDVVVVKKENLEKCLSSCSELNETSAKFIKEKNIIDEKNEDSSKNNKILTVNTPKECHGSTKINSTPAREGSEDSPSDSSYDCKISITLNTNPNAIKLKTESERQNYETYCLEENSNSVTTVSLKRSSSHMIDIKPENKQESEMSLEMKQKLLEILEGEIKREIGISCEVSSGPSNDGFMFKAGDSDGNLRSQSTGSSSDNIEALAQLSTTMRQYLTYLKEMKRLPDENKDDEEF